MKTIILQLLLTFFLTVSSIITAQPGVINVAENTFKVSGMHEEVFYYAFAEGDQLIFNFQEMDRKELKEIEILEYPSNSKFMEFKTRSAEKTITVSKAGIYKFRFNNGALLGRVCKIKIDRVAASEKTAKFNTAVKWIGKADTSWNVFNKDVVVGYDTVLLQKTKKVLVSSEQHEELIMDKNQTVHSEKSIYGSNRCSLFFTLPDNFMFGLVTRRVISWAYWVGVGENANKAWQQNCKLMSNVAGNVAGIVTSPLGGLLVGQLTELILPKSGEDVGYGITDAQNKDLFIQGYTYRNYDSGKGAAGYKKFTNQLMLGGTWFIILYNDNIITPVDVNVKVTALVEKNVYEHQPYTEQKITPRYENKAFKEAVVKIIQVPVATN